MIDQARRTLDVYAEEIADRQVEEALIAAHRRGVVVRIICTGAGDVRRLQDAGLQVITRKTPYIHAKIFLADGTAMFLGSENISATSLDNNREMGLIISTHRRLPWSLATSR